MNTLEKLLKAKELLHEAELEFIEQDGYCPYELGFTLRKLDETIESVKNKFS